MAVKLARLFGLCLIYSVLGYFYLLPATRYFFVGRSDIMLGDGSDPTTLPFHYAILLKAWSSHWTQLLFGAVHTSQLNPPGGWLLWFTWVEKILVPLIHPIATIEQSPTIVAWILMVGNGLAFYLFGRTLSWPRIVSFSLGMAWAFNAFTRARVSVHLGMSATFFLPLAFVGVAYLFRHTTWKEKGLAAFALLASVSCHHYFIVQMAFLSPFLLFFGYLRGTKKTLHDFNLSDLALALVPLLFLIWNLAMPAPAGFISKETVTSPPPIASELFMRVFAAEPIDYLGFDPKHGFRDWNPIRQKINRRILDSLGEGADHERSNGIRWSLLLLALWAVSASIYRGTRVQLTGSEQHLIWLFLGIGVFAFWTSLSPDRFEFFGIRWSPFVLMNGLYKQFRVPSRFSVWVHFSVLSICGVYLSRAYEQLKGLGSPKKKWFRFASFLFPIIVFVDFPPLLPIRTFGVLPVVTAKETNGESCGTGLFFPYFSAGASEIRLFPFGQQIMRGTTCRIVNQPTPSRLDERLAGYFSLSSYERSRPVPSALEQVQKNLISYVQCSQLDWIYFRLEASDQSWREKVCRGLGWEMVSPRFCRSPDPQINRFPGGMRCVEPLR